MGTITASNFKVYKSETYGIDLPYEGGGISANEIQFDVALTGTITFGSTTGVVGSGTAFRDEVKIGDLLYNSTNDTYTSALRVVAITDATHLTLASAYGGTTGAGKT
jgi:hypothetical protein